MTNKLFSYLVLFALFFVSCASQEGKEVVISNPSQLERTDELFVIEREVLEKNVGKIAKGKFVALKGNDGKLVPIQFDDLNADGIWDEAAFLVSLKPSSSWNGSFSLSDTAAIFQQRAHVRHRRKNNDGSFGDALQRDTAPAGQKPTNFAIDALPPFLTEGPAWENDKVGFRIYFDIRNGKDIWGKTTTRMMMDTVGVNPAINYHQKADWGMDVLKVGASLGAGSLALSIPVVNGKDTLVRLGGVNMGSVIYEKLADGPVRAVFRLHYPEWKVGDNISPVGLTEEISIWGGQYFYNSKVAIENPPAGARLVTGIVNLYSKVAEHIDTAGANILFTFDTQTENKDKLGMAIISPVDHFHAFGETPNADTDVQQTYTLTQNIKGRDPLTFRFYAGWEKSDKRFTSAESFRNFLMEEAVKYTQAVKLSWK